MKKEFSVPLPVTVEDDMTIVSYLVRHASQRPDMVLFETRTGQTWQPLTASKVLDEVRALAALLYRRGIRRGDKVAMMSRTRLEWSLIDLATWYLGATVVPVYETSSPEQTQWILADSGASLAVAETSDLADVIVAARTIDSGHLAEAVLVIEDGDLAASAPTESELEAINAEYAQRSLDDVATIIYTSGTTGRPKGAVLTQGNFVVLCEGTLIDLHEVVEGEGVRTLLFLPMAHVFARILSVLCIIQGVPLGHTPDTSQAVTDIATFKPTFLMSVPRIWEKVYTGAEQKQGGGLKRRIFIWAVRVAIAYSRALDASGPSAALKAQHRLADKLVLSKLRAALGGNLTYAISGGAPLGARLGHFYRGIGLTVLEGYGLTETTAPLTVNRPGATKIGTVGYALPGTTIGIDDDGEIMCRGVGVFSGYHNNEEATREAFRDGWFATGDLGDMDEDGFVTITGRKKEIIVTAGGKNVAPSMLEDRLRVHPLVSQCMVVGDDRPFIGVLVTLDRDMLPIWLKNKGLEPMDIAEAKKHPLVLERLQGAIARANSGVSRAESIREMRILDDDFTIDNGALTPSLKVKRHVVAERYAADIDALYADAKKARDSNGG
ncbi:AMP-dependent synthetase/ligase [Bowdeniella massiliensis]|uniref:AMP-dependent synthetase/ligase n=1 Tax=Bowdeniella massiliensis TaxID=2932264 RepID=UPI00202805D3|nr:long-chain fatty acid--CoA ligase [Bowdeniella massiliensis]